MAKAKEAGGKKKRAKRYMWAYPAWVGKIMKPFVLWSNKGEPAKARARGQHKYANMLENELRKIKKMR